MYVQIVIQCPEPGAVALTMTTRPTYIIQCTYIHMYALTVGAVFPREPSSIFIFKLEFQVSRRLARLCTTG
jgi:hypothetical protein